MCSHAQGGASRGSYRHGLRLAFASDASERASWIFPLIADSLLTIATGESLDAIHAELDVAQRSASSSR
jgi:hypothetical protein